MAVLVAIALAVVGCTPIPVLRPVASPTAPSPSAVPQIDVADSPVPFIDLPCADMISEAELFAAFGVTVTPTPPDLTGWDGAVHPTSFALESLGGLDCNWTNGQPRAIQTENGPRLNPTFVGVTVQAMPQATEEWELYNEYYSSPLESYFDCYRLEYERNQLSCGGEQLAGTTWTEITVVGLPVESGAALDTATLAAGRLWDAALARITSAPPTSVDYVPPTEIMELELSCDQFVTPEEAQRVLGAVNTPYLDSSDGGWNLRISAYRLADSYNCYWAAPDTFDGVGIMNHFLEGGEWAFERMLEETPQRFEKLDLAGLAPDDTAYLDCGLAEECTIHLVIGHSWITFRRTEAQAPGAVPVGRQSLIRLGELTVARLRG